MEGEGGAGERDDRRVAILLMGYLQSSSRLYREHVLKRTDRFMEEETQ